MTSADLSLMEKNVAHTITGEWGARPVNMSFFLMTHGWLWMSIIHTIQAVVVLAERGNVYMILISIAREEEKRNESNTLTITASNNDKQWQR